MAKKEKKLAHSTLELISDRQKLVGGAVWSGISVSLVVVLLYAIYMVLVMLTFGYGTIKPLQALESLKEAKLFFLNGQGSVDALALTGDKFMLVRWVILLGVFLVAFLLGLWTYKSVFKRNDAKAKKLQENSLKGLMKEEVGLDSVLIESTDTSKDQDVFNQIGLQNTSKEFFITVASDVMSYDIAQLEYTIADKKHKGILFITELSQPKTTGYVQFRSFGRNPYKLHNGKKIETYALSNVPSNNPFVVVSDMDKEDVGRLVEEKMVDEIVKLKALTRSGVILTLNGNTLSILLNDANFNYLKPLSTRVDERLLENQSEAVSSMYESLLAITRSFSSLPSDTPLVEDKIGEKQKVTSEEVAHEVIA